MLNRIGLWAVGPLYAAFMLMQVGYSVDVETATIVTLNATDVITVDDVTVGDDLVVTDAVTAASVTATALVQGADLNATDDLTVTDDTTLTDAVVANGAVTLGSNDVDNITINGPIQQNVYREDFTYGATYSSSSVWAANAATDTAVNLIHLYSVGGIGFIEYRLEQALGTQFLPVASGYLNLDLDDTDNDGIDLTFGQPRDSSGSNGGSGWWNETTSPNTYCEISLVIADISETDSVYFGWFLDEAYQDAGAYQSHNTYAVFALSDALGDLDILTELNAGGTLNDDTGVTWADGNEKVLRVTLLADSVSFTLDGTAVTQTNAVLNADDGDIMNCGAGWLNATGDATPAPGIRINYVEIGVAQ